MRRPPSLAPFWALAFGALLCDSLELAGTTWVPALIVTIGLTAASLTGFSIALRRPGPALRRFAACAGMVLVSVVELDALGRLF